MNILCIRLGHPGDTSRSGIAEELERRGHHVDDRVIAEGSRWQIIRQILLMPVSFGGYDAIISTSYHCAFAVSLRLRAQRRRPLNIVIGFNLSGRPWKVGVRPADALFNWIFRRLDLVIVHSTAEIGLMGELHHLDRNKIHFVPWGFDLPDEPAATPSVPVPDGPLFCMIGRNNRDFATFSVAVEKAGCKGVIITDRFAEVPATGPHVQVIYNAPLAECMFWIERAVANVILVNDEMRGAGHITAVLGMLLKRPHIFSRAQTIADYLQAPDHGIAVAMHDADDTARAMQLVIAQPQRAQEMALRGYQHARHDLSHAAVTRQMADLVEQALARRPSGRA
ncbi:hypothetical protein [Aestuariivirga sp.]|uniref:hypothetical protein n=1 Tax=Aestuariivirga sp. TaxID=2650926 RepID=UPI0039E57CCE